MNRPFTVEQSLRVLDELREAGREWAARESSLAQAGQERTTQERRRRDSMFSAEEQRLSEDRARGEEAFVAEKSRLQERFEGRSAHIREAHRRARKSLLERIEAQEGGKKFELQREMLQVTRDRDTSSAAADTALKDFNERLAGSANALAQLEGRLTVCLGAHGRPYIERLRSAHERVEGTVPALGHEALAMELDSLLERSHRDSVAFCRGIWTRLSRLWGLWLVLVLSPLPVLPVLQYFSIASITYLQALGLSAALAIIGLAIYFIGRRAVRESAQALIEQSGQARVLLHACSEKAQEAHRQEKARIGADYQTATQRATDAWSHAVETAAAQRVILPAQLEEKARKIQENHQRLHDRRQSALLAEHEEALRVLRENSERNRQEFERAAHTRRIEADQREAAERRSMEENWRQSLQRFYEAVGASAAAEAARAPRWDSPGWEEWNPPAVFLQAARFGSFDVDLPGLLGSAAAALPHGAETHVSLPLTLTYPDAGSLVIEAPGKQARPQALGVLNQIVLRLFSGAPPGRVAFTVIDPVGLGQSFAGLMHLTDEAEHLLHGRIWTQTEQIEQRLADLTDHMEKVIQMYLRNEYATIAEYNQEAGNIAEKYQFLVVADFPRQFSEIALQRFLNIATNGPRCGVYLLVHWDSQSVLPANVAADALWKHCVRLVLRGELGSVKGRALPGVDLRLEAPPASEVATAFVHRVAQVSVDSNRVEVPFLQVAPREDDLWSLDSTTELRVPIGRTGATKLQYLAIGKGTRQHTLVAGKTGSGKSTLFHVIITNLALWCSPEEVEFYLVDFKKGVEFKCYATHRLPHARVVAIESDREFGLSVLQRIDEELKRRGELFRDAGVQDIAGYRRAAGAGGERVPRVLLIIDEFQELFVEEDRIAQSASLLLDRIVRQGRAFGVHALLGSQTLGGAYTVARSTLGQMVIRIALQCNEADAYLIMDENNPAPRLLSRPGEGIYNDAAGARDGNSHFQTVWLPDDVRDARLLEIRDYADRQRPDFYAGPMVFEGDAPAVLGENPLLRGLLAADDIHEPPTPRAWLGEPNSIKGPTEVSFSRRSGHHLLIVGQREDAVLGMMTASLLALSAQHRPGDVEFVLFDGTPAESQAGVYWARFGRNLPHPLTGVRQATMEETLARLYERMKASGERPADTGIRSTYVLIQDIQQFKRFRLEDDFSFGGGDGPPSAATLLKELIADGSSLGTHFIVSCDTYANVVRYLGRKSLGEFGMRVLFQMGANDSASLIDNPAASRLGLHRALLHFEREGQLELFRPYTVPDEKWLESAFRDLAGLARRAELAEPAGAPEI